MAGESARSSLLRQIGIFLPEKALLFRKKALFPLVFKVQAKKIHIYLRKLRDLRGAQLDITLQKKEYHHGRS
ncbi:hypothetical protein [Biformimicrobium ophioploci]|uniref:hypothetical protein n=1 Tax=Biformimicrobium ophioploci TaxID=3036711 RepID=UPI0025544CEC|nr:hypothetical protein [Microbulbifer sp. NKW57]